MASKVEQDLGAAIDAANRAGSGGPADGFVAGLAARVGANAGVKAVFGEPIERDGLTVIPVAKVRWGFGGAAGGGFTPRGGSPGADPESAEPDAGESGPPAAGEAGGGGASADPIGWLEIGPDGASFRPIEPAMPSPGFLLAASFSAAMLVRSLARLLRR